MVIFRENTEDIYAGIEFEAETEEAKRSSPSSRRSSRSSRRSASRDGWRRHQPVSREGWSAWSASIEYALKNGKKSVTFVQGQHHEVHRGRVHEGATPPSASSGTRSTPAPGRRPRKRRAKRRPTPSRRRSSRRASSWSRTPSPTSRPAGPHPPEGVRRHRDLEPQRRLPVGRAGGAGRRHRHRPRRQHQLRHRSRHLRGHARHRPEVRRSDKVNPGSVILAAR